MGPLFSIVFWGIAGIGFFIFCYRLWRVGKRTQHWAPFQFAVGLGVSFCLFVGIWFGIGFIPSYVFYSNFGFAPTADVTELKGYSFSIFDGGEAYLKFHAAPGTISRITSEHFFEIKEEEFKREMDSLPDWWRPSDSLPTQFYRADNFGHGFSGSSIAVICYNEANSSAYFYWSGID